MQLIQKISNGLNLSLKTENGTKFIEVSSALESKIGSSVTNILNEIRNSHSLTSTFHEKEFLANVQMVKGLIWFDKYKNSDVVENHLMRIRQNIAEFL